MKKIKILIISEVFYPEIGSGAYRVTNLFKYLKKLGYEVDILTSVPNYPDRKLYEQKKFWNKHFEKVLIGTSNLYRVKQSKIKISSNFFKRLYIYILFLLRSIKKILFIKNEYDLVFVTVPSIFIGFLGIIAKYKFKAKMILDIRDLWPECLKGIGVFKNIKGALRIGYFLEKFLLKYPDSIIINSDAFRTYLKDLNLMQQIYYIPNGLTKYDLRNNKELLETEVEDKKLTIIYTGLIGLAQNIRSIVKSANLLKYNKNIEFKIIGTGVQVEKVQELIDYYKLSNIKILLPMTKEKVLAEVARSSITILNLRGDSGFDLVMPGKLVDYMSMGKPIIAGVDGYTKAIIEESACGIVVNPDDYKAMAQAIAILYRNEDLKTFLGENGFKYCIDKFLWDKNIKKVDEVIKITLGDK
ncbi:MAG: glycosyltransferase family 4 protein [Sarcina sp.]